MQWLNSDNHGQLVSLRVLIFRITSTNMAKSQCFFSIMGSSIQSLAYSLVSRREKFPTIINVIFKSMDLRRPSKLTSENCFSLLRSKSSGFHSESNRRPRSVPLVGTRGRHLSIITKWPEASFCFVGHIRCW